MEEKEERNVSKYNDQGNQGYNYDYEDNGGDEYFENDGNDDYY